MTVHFMTQNNFYFRIKSQIEEADIIEMNIPIFRGKGSGPNAGEKVHRYDVTYQLLLRAVRRNLVYCLYEIMDLFKIHFWRFTVYNL